MTWGWVAKLNYFITQITSKYDLTMFCGHGNELGKTLPGKGAIQTEFRRKEGSKFLLQYF